MKNIKYLIPIALASSAVGGAVAVANAENTRHAPPTKAEVRHLFDRWNAALKSGDANRVARLYARDAVLLATLKNQPLDTPAEIRNYFRDDFLPQKPQGKITKSIVKILGPNLAMDIGTYVFRVTDAQGKVTMVPARYTFVYERDHNGKWKILHHHSSKFPVG
jgi:uncharacterized protein (TIGR02246 family)